MKYELGLGDEYEYTFRFRIPWYTDYTRSVSVSAEIQGNQIERGMYTHTHTHTHTQPPTHTTPPK